MAALDFPNSPTVGQTYPSPPVAGVPTYTWNGTSWNTTSGGIEFSSGTVMQFAQAAAPTNWTRVTTYDDALIRIVGSATPSSGGTNGFVAVYNTVTATGNFTLATAQMGSHSHTLPGGDAGPVLVPNSPQSIYAVQSNGSANSTVTGAAGGGGAHGHSITRNIKYVDMLLASKN
jgi:hypothetical protein